MLTEREIIESIIVNADQMQKIEKQIFQAGMPVAALMEKAALLTANQVQNLYPCAQFLSVGILVGPGHNGGDALVIARELALNGYQVLIYQPLSKSKELTAQHAQYAHNLGLKFAKTIESLQNCDLIVDGLFGFGLEREITGQLALDIEQLNQWKQPRISVDIPSGIHTDTGQVLGIAVQASHTFCLGLWKQAFFQDSALKYCGQVTRIDFGIPAQYLQKVLVHPAPIQVMTSKMATQSLPLNRSITTHKYKQGHLLLICGSRNYAGSAILAGLGARSSGVGMLSIAVPSSLKSLLVNHLPEALIIECPETKWGAISSLPSLEFNRYNAIACGCGLTQETISVVETILNTNLDLILDADALNIIAAQNQLAIVAHRSPETIFTPHWGEFKRLFPSLIENNRLQITQQAAQSSQATILLKGAKTIIASPQGKTWLISQSTPALARGGSGDVLTGLIGGLIAQKETIVQPLVNIVASGAWLHQQGAILAAQNRSKLGVDGSTLSEYILQAIALCNTELS